jgi:hypothetical protein
MKDDEKKSLLPIPEAAVRHHMKTLEGPMKEWRAKKRVPPVLLLTGLTGVGKRSMGWFLSQWILCERNGLQTQKEDEQESLFGMAAPASEILVDPESEPRPCGECPQCMKALHGTWIDFTEIEAEDQDSDGAASGPLKIEQFRKLKSSLGFGGHESKYRIVLIPNAERMTVQAANSVLKLLEEPPAGWIFLLTAADSTLLLPTIVSRCQTIRLKPFPRETIEKLLRLENIDEKKIPICAELAQGSWGKAMDWSQPETWEKRKLIVDFLQDPKSQLNALVDWASVDPRNMDRMMDQLESLASDLIRWSLSGVNASAAPGSPENYRWINQDAKSALVQSAKRALQTGHIRARTTWLSHAERIARARVELQAPVNRKLLAQGLLMPWL